MQHESGKRKTKIANPVDTVWNFFWNDGMKIGHPGFSFAVLNCVLSPSMTKGSFKFYIMYANEVYDQGIFSEQFKSYFSS